jgi:monoamine oxidase
MLTEYQPGNIIIIGAGVCGLVAGYSLAKAGVKPLILEARNRTGGRIFTTREPGFGIPQETGAEFIHGKLTQTFALIKEFGLETIPVKGKMIRISEAGTERANDIISDQHRHLEKSLAELEEDTSVENFIEKYLPSPAYEKLATEVRGFVQGYDAADTGKASAFSFREEWLDAEWEQYRIRGGYSTLTDALTAACEEKGCTILLNQVVRKITWRKGYVEVQAASGEIFTSEKLLVTLPPSILKLSGEDAPVRFDPEIPAVRDAAGKLGYGSVIKFILQFSEPFWQKREVEKRIGKNLQKLGFLFSEARVPTWWTQYPEETPMLTGWLAGPRATGIEYRDEHELLEIALGSLSEIFAQPKEYIASLLTAFEITDWGKDVFSQGAYSYKTVDDQPHVDLLQKPVDDTIFFGGEAISPERGNGTVEAAIVSGISAAAKLL